MTYKIKWANIDFVTENGDDYLYWSSWCGFSGKQHDIDKLKATNKELYDACELLYKYCLSEQEKQELSDILIGNAIEQANKAKKAIKARKKLKNEK